MSAKRSDSNRATEDQAMIHSGIPSRSCPEMGPKSWQLTAVFLLCSVVAWADQLDLSTDWANEALALCEAADAVPARDRAAILSRGLERAEEAVRANSRDAAAHFAVFCNLGKTADLRRGALGFVGILRDLARVRREIDDTLTLAPNYPAALAAKGEMLRELPLFLGGDPDEGQRLLHRAATLDPENPRIRSMLADGFDPAESTKPR
jgi:hypothetical protein